MDVRCIRVALGLLLATWAPLACAPPRTAGWRALAAARASRPEGALALRWPVAGRVTSPFGRRLGRAHQGIDIGAPLGTEVRAAAAGSVLFAGLHSTYGNMVIVEHAPGLVTVYAHHARNLVRTGESVRAGERIAQVGATGRATGPHLHFEVRQAKTPQNPILYLPGPFP